MIRQLFLHYLKEQRRSAAFHKNLASNVFIGLMVGLLMLNILALGLYIDRILAEVAPDEDPITLFNRFVIYYFGFELWMRIIFSKPKIQSVLPYLHLPVKRSTLAHYTVSRSFLSPFNVAALLIAVPFSIKVIRLVEPVGAIKWLLSIFIFSLIMALVNAFLQRQQSIRPRWSLFYFGALALIGGLDYFGIISLSNISAWFFDKIIFESVFFLVPIILLGLIYWTNYRSFKWHIYPAATRRASAPPISATAFPLLDQLGQVGKYMELELTLILRNKRARSTVLSTLLLIAICFLFYVMEDRIEYRFLLVYIGLTVTGMGLLAYGQFLWEGNYLDLILSRNVNTYQYFKAKYFLLILLNSALFVLILPLGFFGWDIFLLNIALFLYNIGINSIVVMFITTYSRKRLDLEAAVTSPQGKGTSQYLTILPTIILPMIIVYLPFTAAGFESMGIAAFAILGLTGLSLRRVLIKLVVRQFNRQKYKILAAFREG